MQSIGGGVWMFSMLAFDHWGLNPERDNIQFRIIGDQAVMAKRLQRADIDGAYLGYAFGAQLERQGFVFWRTFSSWASPFRVWASWRGGALLIARPTRWNVPPRDGRDDKIHQYA